MTDFSDVNGFPYYNHLQIRLKNIKGALDGDFVKRVVAELVEGLKLKVMKEAKYIFEGGGVTSVHILSQSHLVVHTWPEHQSVHLDLMTCSQEINTETVKAVVENWRKWAEVEVVDEPR